MQDLQLQCEECNSTFVFTVGEQEFFQQKGFTTNPKRCPDCRSMRKARDGSKASTTGGGEKFNVTCSRCGKPTTVPFQPSTDRAVFCRDCFKQTKKGSVQ